MIDKNTIFSNGQSIVANATTVTSTNLIDLGAQTDDRGVALNSFGVVNGKIWLNVSVGVQPTQGTGIQVELTDCDTEGGTYKATGIGVNAAIPNATLTDGYTILSVPLPQNVRRYLKMLYTTTGNHTGSAGTINANLSYGTQSENVAPYRA